MTAIEPSGWITPTIDNVLEAAAEVPPESEAEAGLFGTRQFDESTRDRRRSMAALTRQNDESAALYKHAPHQQTRQNDESTSLLKEEAEEEKRKGSKLGAFGSDGERGLMGRIMALVGEAVMEGDGKRMGDGGKWRARIRRQAGKVERVVAAMESERREGKLHYAPGGYLEDLWKRFAD